MPDTSQENYEALIRAMRANPPSMTVAEVADRLEQLRAVHRAHVAPDEPDLTAIAARVDEYEAAGAVYFADREASYEEDVRYDRAVAALEEHAADDVPTLLSEVRRLTAERDKYYDAGHNQSIYTRDAIARLTAERDEARALVRELVIRISYTNWPPDMPEAHAKEAVVRWDAEGDDAD